MNCPKCKSDTKVVDSRTIVRDSIVWRRRKCKSCDHSFSTYEAESHEGRMVRVKIKLNDKTVVTEAIVQLDNRSLRKSLKLKRRKERCQT